VEAVNFHDQILFRTSARIVASPHLSWCPMCYKNNIQVACLLVTTLQVGPPLAAQEVGYNDLTTVGANSLKHSKFSPDSSCNDMGGGGLGMAIGCPPKTYPFTLSLLVVDTSELPIDGELIILLRLRNVGHDSAFVPWLTDSGQMELPDDNGKFRFCQADLRADIRQESGGTAHISIPVHLYGAREVPGSLQEIRPGEYVEIRVRLILDSGNEEIHSLKAGPATLSFTWTEWDSQVTYEKCGIQTSQSRSRELTSDAAVMNVNTSVTSQ